VARLNFLAGPRLIAHLTATHTYLTSTAAILSCGGPNVPERVQQVVDDRKTATKRVEEVELELAKHIATDLAREMQGADTLVKKHIHRTDDSGTVLPFLTAISSAFSEVVTKTGLEVPYLIILSSSPSAQMATNTNVVFILGSDDNRVKEVGDALKTKLGVKGGGKGKWSGKFVGVWKNGREDVAIEDILNKVL
jgi:misacylated tRNA(Ala) deacylase